MKEILARVLECLTRPVVNRLELATGSKFVNNSAVAQKVLMNQYRYLATAGKSHLPQWKDVGFRKYSQFEEDGILLYLFSLIPPQTRKCVEICAGSGRECMTANLIINHGWQGYLFDGNGHSVAAGRKFFAKNKDTFLYPPVYTQAWITAENVNEIIERAGAKGPIDLLSLDVDGMDYWLWKAIDVVKPRVVVCETSNLIPADQALTVPYEPAFECKDEEFRGASLAAMCKLGKSKGYRLVGTHRHGFNAFFVQDGEGEAFFPEVSCAECLNDGYTQYVRTEKWPRVQHMGWVEV